LKRRKLAKRGFKREKEGFNTDLTECRRSGKTQGATQKRGVCVEPERRQPKKERGRVTNTSLDFEEKGAQEKRGPKTYREGKTVTVSLEESYTPVCRRRKPGVGVHKEGNEY